MAAADHPTAAEAGPTLPPLDSAAIPRATYRIQFHGGFTFDDGVAIVPYLRDLGISHLYASPYLKARAGSTHGYDIIDHNALNPEIGDERSFDELCAALREHGLGQILDVVPNHMGVLEADNAWWLDVLENGAASPHATTFDIDWTPTAADMEGQVLLAVLGSQYGEVLEAGELELHFDPQRGEFRVDYYDHRLPIDPREYARVLGAALPDGARAEEASALVERFAALPRRDDVAVGEGRRGSDAERRVRRDARIRDAQSLKAELARLHGAEAWVRDWVRVCLDAHRGTPPDARSFDRLDALLRRQPWRLAHWRVGGDEINYRRFFDVNTLAAIRTERQEVFEATHRTLLGWVAEGRLDGLRIDHPDGLADPAAYFRALQQAFARIQADGARGAQAKAAPRALYVVIEKILAEHEPWPSGWPVHGDTGYRFSNQVNGVFVDARNASEFDRIYDAFVGRHVDYDETLVDAKRGVMSRTLAADLHMLAERAYRIAQSDRRTRDFTRNGLRRAIAELAAAFPVYRTYIDDEGVHDVDRRHLDWAAALARRRGHAPEPTALDWLRRLMLEAPTEPDPPRREAAMRFVRRFQQFTPPVTAKAMEDTAFYRYHRLVSLNDVGGEPHAFGFSVAAFHAENQARQRFMPHTMLGTSTHDSKRSEDVRARLDVLSEMPWMWRDALGRWHEMNRRRAERVEGDADIDANDEMLLYQTLVGAWPLGPMDDAALAAFRERVQAYMLKAVREAKQRTSWLDPDADYEAALARFVDTLLAQLEPNPFLTDLRGFVDHVAPFGCFNGLSQLALKLTVPGVPDLYQGCESWALNLVDPDNRRPVDFDTRRRLLAGLSDLWRREGGIPAEQLRAMREQSLHDGRLKMLVAWRLLQARAQRPALYERGRYLPLTVSGHGAEYVVAFARELDGETQITVAGRLLRTLSGGDAASLFDDGAASRHWRDSRIELPGGAATAWIDQVTGRRVDLAEGRVAPVLAALPVAVLVPASSA